MPGDKYITDEDAITVKDAVEISGLTEPTLRNYAASGILNWYCNPAGKMRLSRQEVELLKRYYRVDTLPSDNPGEESAETEDTTEIANNQRSP